MGSKKVSCLHLQPRTDRNHNDHQFNSYSPPNPKETLNNEMLEGLELADKKQGGQLDIIIGILDTAACILSEAPKHCPRTGIIPHQPCLGGQSQVL